MTNVNQSFGRLDIRYSSKFDPHCNWIINGYTGITQAVAIVSINQIYLGQSRYAVVIFVAFILIKACQKKKKNLRKVSSAQYNYNLRHNYAKKKKRRKRANQIIVVQQQ